MNQYVYTEKSQIYKLMTDRQQILKKFLKIEDRLLVSKMLDKALKTEKSKMLVYSDFLDPYQKTIVEKVFSNMDDVDYTITGGYIGAERVIIIFRPNFVFKDDFGNPFKVLDIVAKGRGSLSHRDYLGALMGLGIKREKIGDILVSADTDSNRCQIIVLGEISEYIRYNLVKVGTQNVEIELKDTDEFEVSGPKMLEISTTVASLRLDSVASAGFGISRSKIVDLIKAERVTLDWEGINSLTKQVKEGDTISIRGKGRVVLDKVGKITKKGRISLVLKKYI
jgi:RNA-binding protein YlmH